VFPDWKLQKDNTIKHSIEKEIDDVSFHGDYLDDLFTDSDE
jgi:hypothetical protein